MKPLSGDLTRSTANGVLKIHKKSYLLENKDGFSATHESVFLGDERILDDSLLPVSRLLSVGGWRTSRVTLARYRGSARNLLRERTFGFQSVGNTSPCQQCQLSKDAVTLNLATDSGRGIRVPSAFRAANAPPNSELFRGLKCEEVDSILKEAKPHRFSPKSLVTYQGAPASHLYMLWQGRARYFFLTPDGKKHILIWITPGRFFGENALVSRQSTYIVSTEVIRESIVLAWDGATARALAQRFTRLFENAFLISVDYLTWYVATHGALTSQSARERLANVLLEFSASIGQKVSGGIELDVTNEELANATNLGRYTVSRIFTEWQKTGAIRKRHKGLILLSPKALFRRV